VPRAGRNYKGWIENIGIISRMIYWGTPPQQGAAGAVGAVEVSEEQEESPTRAPAAMSRRANFIFNN